MSQAMIEATRRQISLLCAYQGMVTPIWTDDQIQTILDEFLLEEKDASGHEHKGKGPGGGQFTKGSGGGGGKESDKEKTSPRKSSPQRDAALKQKAIAFLKEKRRQEIATARGGAMSRETTARADQVIAHIKAHKSLPPGKEGQTNAMMVFKSLIARGGDSFKTTSSVYWAHHEADKARAAGLHGKELADHLNEKIKDHIAIQKAVQTRKAKEVLPSPGPGAEKPTSPNPKAELPSLSAWLKIHGDKARAAGMRGQELSQHLNQKTQEYFGKQKEMKRQEKPAPSAQSSPSEPPLPTLQNWLKIHKERGLAAGLRGRDLSRHLQEKTEDYHALQKARKEKAGTESIQEDEPLEFTLETTTVPLLESDLAKDGFSPDDFLLECKDGLLIPLAEVKDASSHEHKDPECGEEKESSPVKEKTPAAAS